MEREAREEKLVLPRAHLLFLAFQPLCFIFVRRGHRWALYGLRRTVHKPMAGGLKWGRRVKAVPSQSVLFPSLCDSDGGGDGGGKGSNMSTHRKTTINKKESNTITTCSQFPSILDSDQPFTEQELEAIDAIEAAFLSIPPSSSTETAIEEAAAAEATLSSSVTKFNRRHSSSPQQDHHRPRTRRQLPNSLSRPKHQDIVRMRFPPIKFQGQILYSRTPVEVEKAAVELLQRLQAKREAAGQVSVGFDIEWKPTFRKGVPPGKAAVMQICGDSTHCHVMHIIHSGITRSLQCLLEDSTLLKVGIGIGSDSTKVFKDYNISVKAVEDLSRIANKKLGGQPRVWGLQSLTEILTGKTILKPGQIRKGNWEANALSKAQLQYAATDAFANWHLYEVLKDLPDKEDAADQSCEQHQVELTELEVESES